jgi:hypothetical protein
MGCSRIFPPYCTTGGRIADGGGDYTWGVVVHSIPDAPRGERNGGGDVDDSCGVGVWRARSVDVGFDQHRVCESCGESQNPHWCTQCCRVSDMLLPWYRDIATTVAIS